MDKDLRGDARAFIRKIEGIRLLSSLWILAFAGGITWHHDLAGLTRTLTIFFSFLGAWILYEIFTVKS